MGYKFRGNPTEKGTDGYYVYTGTNELVSENWKTKPCGRCGEGFTKEGHDPCIGTLPNVMNACCGHGYDREAYIQFEDGSRTAGVEAINKIKQLKDTP